MPAYVRISIGMYFEVYLEFIIRRTYENNNELCTETIIVNYCNLTDLLLAVVKGTLHEKPGMENYLDTSVWWNCFASQC